MSFQALTTYSNINVGRCPMYSHCVSVPASVTSWLWSCWSFRSFLCKPSFLTLCLRLLSNMIQNEKLNQLCEFLKQTYRWGRQSSDAFFRHVPSRNTVIRSLFVFSDTCCCHIVNRQIYASMYPSQIANSFLWAAPCNGTLQRQRQHPSSKAHTATHLAAVPAPKLQSAHRHLFLCSYFTMCLEGHLHSAVLCIVPCKHITIYSAQRSSTAQHWLLHVAF